MFVQSLHFTKSLSLLTNLFFLPFSGRPFVSRCGHANKRTAQTVAHTRRSATGVCGDAEDFSIFVAAVFLSPTVSLLKPTVS